ncbi:uncharacterized protein LOC113233079 isoform X2 [Hyposmocoma kahamanoa]|uniref:uncharacterized protein LOC113233079 isoform X2 n=1 Tax=Hyposmocoma kahamanoa TaxID=1477025 RepID=UPI000E6D703E|nr:uncharacterized protein LOC113233079 isoform X2 [Hyposmocoma kahamanoa]
MEKSSTDDDVVYINKIIKKHEIPSAHRSGAKKRADIFCKNIFKDDLQQSPGEMHPTMDTVQEGAFRYVLSDRTFIEKGWTLLPIEKVVRKTNVYRMRPAHPEFDWFEHNKVKGVMHYDSGEKLAEFKDNGLGQWFYRNGRLALDYYDAKDLNAQQRIVIYSNGELDERGRSRPVTILGMFDYVGNGVIFDHSGKVRLKYNQSEGVLLDQQIGPASHWKWHSLNDPPVLQQVMIDTQMHHKDPRIARLGNEVSAGLQDNNKDMVAIEFENAIKEKSQKISEKFSPFQIKMKALKINENFSIRILDQASIYLLFRDGTTNLKLNLGMLLDSHEIVDTDIADMGEISTGLERLPAQTESLEALQRNIKYAQNFERYRTERDRCLRLPVPAASVDRIKNLISKPLQPELAEVNYVTVNGQCERCYSRKPSICALYYNNRLS